MAASGRLPPLAVYGTLLDAEVRRLVLGRCRTRAATLNGWERLYVAGQTYPGVREQAGAATDVLVLEGLGPQALARGDAFEGPEYERRGGAGGLCRWQRGRGDALCPNRRRAVVGSALAL